MGALELDLALMELLVDGQRRPMEAKPLALLRALMLRAGQVATKRELIEAVWGNADHISEASLTTAVSKLRLALGEPGRHLIEVVHGSGYRLGGAVDVLAARDQRRLAIGLRADEAVPGRPQWRLESLLSLAPLNDVWLARHEKTGEARVFKFADSPERLATLQREVTLSRLLAAAGTRDTVVQILEWNFTDRPYFIESAYGGPDLQQWSQSPDGLAATPLVQRVAMMAGIARIVAAAHAAGVLHGDLKPANILVSKEDSALRSRLVDFGAGVVADHAELRRLAITEGDLAASGSRTATGTLRYMAPEVLAGEPVSTGADIYALGVVLYQMLAGDLSRPLGAGWEGDVADEFLRDDIAAAAAAAPVRRLSSAAALADRLESLPARHAALAQARREAAHAAGQARQLERYRLRRPWILTASVSMAAGLALSIFFGLRAYHDRDEARRSAALARAVSEFLTEDLLGRGNPAQSGRADETLMQSAQAAEAGIDKRLGEEKLVAGSIHLALAHAFDSRSAYADARAAYDHAIDALGQAGSVGRGIRVVAMLQEVSLEAFSGLSGSAARATARLAQAEGLMGGLAAQPRAEATVWQGAAQGALHLLSDDLAAAQTDFRVAAEQAQAMPRVFTQSQILTLREREAFTYLRLGDGAGAAARFGDILQRRISLNGPDNSNTLKVEIYLAQADLLLGDPASALASVDRIYPIVVRVFGPDHHKTMQLLASRAEALTQLGRYDEALAERMTIYRSVLATTGPRSFFTLAILADIANLRCRAGQIEPGLEAARTAQEAVGASYGQASPLGQAIAAELAFCLVRAKRYEAAAALLPGIDRAAVGRFVLGSDFGAEVDLIQAEIDFANGDRVAGLAQLNAASAALGQKGADAYLRQWANRLRQP